MCLDEGIDELAEYCGAGKAVAEWTARSIDILFGTIIWLFLLLRIFI